MISYATSYVIIFYSDIICDIICSLNCVHTFHFFAPKTWICPAAMPASCPREELHQFLFGQYGEYVFPSSLYMNTQVMRMQERYKSPDSLLVSDAMLRRVWTR